MTTDHFFKLIQKDFDYLKLVAHKFAKNEPDAEDLFQETIYKALKSKNRFKEGTNLTAWLYVIMKNTYISKYQTMKRRKTDADYSLNKYNFIPEQYTNARDENYGPMKLSIDLIMQMVNKLEDAYKTPFMMYFRGFKYIEIAEKLKVPIGTVKNRIHVARKLLQQGLTEQPAYAA